MDLLLSHGANINTTSKHGWTPLMLASKRGNEGCVRWLIDRGADVNHLSPDKWTALAEATISGFTRIMALLLDAGADPEIRAQSDWAPPMHAAYRGDIDAVNMLLAAAAGSATVIKRLLSAGCPPDSMWSRAVEAHSEHELAESAGLEDQAASLKL
jgi:ankyrin repeat protein